MLPRTVVLLHFGHAAPKFLMEGSKTKCRCITRPHVPRAPTSLPQPAFPERPDNPLFHLRPLQSPYRIRHRSVRHPQQQALGLGLGDLAHGRSAAPGALEPPRRRTGPGALTPYPSRPCCIQRGQTRCVQAEFPRCTRMVIGVITWRARWRRHLHRAGLMFLL